jgi:hypothetical protein
LTRSGGAQREARVSHSARHGRGACHEARGADDVRHGQGARHEARGRSGVTVRGTRCKATRPETGGAGARGARHGTARGARHEFF